MTKLYAAIASLLAIIGGIFAIFSKGKQTGRDERDLEMHREDSDAARLNKEIEHDVVTGDSADNRDRLQEWNRD